MSTHLPPSTYILRDLFDIDVLPSISWFPQTVGWQVLGLIVLIFTLIAIWKFVKKWYQNRYRKEAIQVIEATALSHENYARELFGIMKVVLCYLSETNNTTFGAPFYQSLDRYYAKPLDSDLQYVWMMNLVSRQHPATEAQKQQLKQYCLDWLKKHGECQQ
ncbi:DUF4381 domain-containing protein [Vibrio sp. FNV 38]|nr:DUF4381 domain-containing protein [Vibrio sp. FNV 38]